MDSNLHRELEEDKTKVLSKLIKETGVDEYKAIQDNIKALIDVPKLLVEVSNEVNLDRSIGQAHMILAQHLELANKGMAISAQSLMAKLCDCGLIVTGLTTTENEERLDSLEKASIHNISFLGISYARQGLHPKYRAVYKVLKAKLKGLILDECSLQSIFEQVLANKLKAYISNNGTFEYRKEAHKNRYKKKR